jgi:hypothetical protein
VPVHAHGVGGIHGATRFGFALHADLRRRDDLSAEIRDAMAAKIAASLVARLAITRPPGMGDDASLEWLDEGIRKSGTLRQPR